MKIVSEDKEMELRNTYWKCQECKRIYTYANIDKEFVTCPVCNGDEVRPITIFKIINAKEIKK